MNTPLTDRQFTRANWIWQSTASQVNSAKTDEYNEWVLTQKTFTLNEKISDAQVLITADTRYRLVINGEFVQEGPARSWLHSFAYDVVDVAKYLNEGENLIEIIAQYFGAYSTVYQCGKPGLIAELQYSDSASKLNAIGTDESWAVYSYDQMIKEVPHMSFGLGPFEYYNSELSPQLVETEVLGTHDSTCLAWKNLNATELRPMTQNPLKFTRTSYETEYESKGYSVNYPWARHLYPDDFKLNSNRTSPILTFKKIVANKACRVNTSAIGFIVWLNGEKITQDYCDFVEGENILALTNEHFTFCIKNDFHFYLEDVTELNIVEDSGNWFSPDVTPYLFLGEPELHATFPHPVRDEFFEKWDEVRLEMLAKITCVQSLASAIDSNDLAPLELMINIDPIAVTNHHMREVDWRINKSTTEKESHWPYSFKGNADATASTVKGQCLMLDLGVESIGTLSFKIMAPKQTTISCTQFEYLDENGKLQLNEQVGSLYRNGFHYICTEGLNEYRSFRRVAGRYVLIDIKNGSASDVEILDLQFIESTYDSLEKATFTCDDPVMDQVFEASFRTNLLCMEDAFTDCPLYEQAFWVGDYRNSALYSYFSFGSFDLAKHSMQLAGKAMDQFDLIPGTCPDQAGRAIPVWHFLWHVSCWEYYLYSGDMDGLRTIWPYIEKGVERSLGKLSSDGLFSGKFWNFSDWATLNDEGSETALYNQFFLILAIEASAKCAEVIGEQAIADQWRNQIVELKNSVQKFYNSEKKNYPIVAPEEGQEEVYGVHNFVFACLDETLPLEKDNIVELLLNPPEDWVKLASPFIYQFYYEALDKMGEKEQVISNLKENIVPMLEKGATTLWEVFPGTEYAGDSLTRSHCHSWSASALYFIPNIVLGVEITKPGAEAINVSPYPCHLQYAKGTTLTKKGKVDVDWQINDNVFLLKVSHPKGIDVTFVENDSLEKYEVVVELTQY